MAGLENKGNEFWEKLEDWEIIKTWTEKKGWGKIKSKLPKGYDWHRQDASRKNKKGRAIGNI